jgi:hypothetical protein
MNVQRSSDRPSRGRCLAAPTSIKRGAFGTEETQCAIHRLRTSEGHFNASKLRDHRAPEFGRMLPTPPQRSPAVFHVSGIFTAARPDNSSLQPASLPVTTHLGSIIAAFCTIQARPECTDFRACIPDFQCTTTCDTHPHILQ